MTRTHKKRQRDTVCKFCGVDMNLMACEIDWERVWYEKRLQYKEITLERKLTEEEREDLKDECGSDPCDDCCCGSCGSRKSYSGKVCC